MVFYFSKPYFKNRTNKNKQNLSVLFETKKKKIPCKSHFTFFRCYCFRGHQKGNVEHVVSCHGTHKF